MNERKLNETVQLLAQLAADALEIKLKQSIEEAAAPQRSKIDELTRKLDRIEILLDHKYRYFSHPQKFMSRAFAALLMAIATAVSVSYRQTTIEPPRPHAPRREDVSRLVEPKP